MSSQQPMMAMPSIQGEAVELFPRAPLTPVNTGRPGSSRGSIPENNEALLSTILTRRPSTSASENRALVVSPGQARVGVALQDSKSKASGVGGEGGGGGEGRPPLAEGPRCVGRDLDGGGDKRGSSAPEVKEIACYFTRCSCCFPYCILYVSLHSLHTGTRTSRRLIF